jgi:mitochondrial import inner membrane translocase subunit TIM44
MAEDASAAAEKVKASAEKFVEENPELGEKYRAGKETFERGFEGAKESFKGAADAADKRLEGDEKTSGFWAEVKLAAKELFAPAEPPSVNKKLYGEAPPRPEGEGQEDDGGIPNESGTTALVFVAAEAGTWQKLTQRLRETPIIQGILGAAAEAAETETGQKLNQRAKAASKIVGDKQEEASEFWETSQNPWVYRASSIYDGVFGETETGAAIRELRRADPTFELSEWTEGVTQTVLPDVLDWYLRGDAVKLKTWCNDRTQAMMGAVIKERKAAGLVADPSVLDIEGVTVVDAKCQDKQPPIIIVQFAAQQIHCIRNREGEIVDGADDLIEQHYYMFVFQREITKQDELAWRVVEFAPLFKQPYI